jgi:hypothetical protein
MTIEWDGNGQPPYGVECRVLIQPPSSLVEYDGAGMLIASTMQYYVLMLDGDHKPWVRDKRYVTFAPYKSARDLAIDEMREIMSVNCKVSGPTDPKDICAALYDAGYRKVNNETH